MMESKDTVTGTNRSRSGRSATDGATLPCVTTVDLRRFRLRAGEARGEQLVLDVEPFFLGGQRYEAVPGRIPVDLDVSQASGAMVFELRLDATLSGPCMRCLGHADVPVSVRARELHDPDARSGEELRSDYVVDDRLEVGAWARDAIALALPEQILCREDCAGLCPVCGKDLNVEPHEHVDEATDPRWAALQQLRDDM
jgi:uncharacterized protein